MTTAQREEMVRAAWVEYEREEHQARMRRGDAVDAAWFGEDRAESMDGRNGFSIGGTRVA